MGAAYSYIRGSIGERFWAKVNKSDGCWEWAASLDLKGYGNFGVRQESGKYLMQRAHRVAWELVKGEKLTPKQYLCHKCDNRRCVNPDHLFVGDAKANSQDCAKKGRFPDRRGEKNARAKLTADDVLEIRKSTESLLALSKKYNVVKSVVASAKSGETWSHLS